MAPSSGILYIKWKIARQPSGACSALFWLYDQAAIAESLSAQIAVTHVRYLPCRSGGGETFPQEAIQCLDVVLRSTTSFRPDVVTFARGFFLDNRQMSKPIGNGAEVLPVA